MTGDMPTLDVRAEQLLPGDVVLANGPYEVDFVTSRMTDDFQHIYIYPTDGRMTIVKPRDEMVRIRPGQRQTLRHYQTMAAQAGENTVPAEWEYDAHGGVTRDDVS